MPPKRATNNYIPFRPDSDGNPGLGRRIRKAAKAAGISLGCWLRDAAKAYLPPEPPPTPAS